ncbi:MAG: NADPH dehydrogenase NamA [Clostridioides sp.]|jgi:NADPH2 dehydrogenase|nr:NADPH dehydrogenase NamA [Clostridioides sp.]
MKLYTPLKIKDLELKNRIVMPPMCMYSSEDGFANKWHQIHYSTRAIGGVGLIIVESTGVSPEGRISDKDLGLWDDNQVDKLKKIVKKVHAFGGKIAVQLNHAGRKCEVKELEIEAPSPILYSDDYSVPKEMSLSDIKETVSEFKSASRRALAAGFDMIEIHAAHGYLISEFLSPITNKRTDEYGGDYKNRSRLLKEVIKAVSEVWPATKPLCLRVTADDYAEGGNGPSDLAEIINYVKDFGNGVDLVDVSTGGVLPTAPKDFPGYQLPHAEIIRKETGLPVIGGGLITTAAQADNAIEDAQADLVYMGRELLRNPYFPLISAKGLGYDIEWPEQYLRAKPRMK